MGNKGEKVVLEVIDIPFEDAKKIIYKIKDMNLNRGYIMRVSQIWNYDKPTHCEYCDLSNGFINLVDKKYITMNMEYEEGEWFLHANGEDDAKQQINYCPFCGRRLDVDILDRIDQKDKNLIDLNEEE